MIGKGCCYCFCDSPHCLSTIQEYLVIATKFCKCCLHCVLVRSSASASAAVAVAVAVAAAGLQRAEVVLNLIRDGQ